MMILVGNGDVSAIQGDGFKTLVEEGTDRILGAHLLGPHAGEVINLFAMAMRFGLKAGDVKQMLFAYPTSASDVPFML